MRHALEPDHLRCDDARERRRSGYKAAFLGVFCDLASFALIAPSPASSFCARRCRCGRRTFNSAWIEIIGLAFAASTFGAARRRKDGPPPPPRTHRHTSNEERRQSTGPGRWRLRLVWSARSTVSRQRRSHPLGWQLPRPRLAAHMVVFRLGSPREGGAVWAACWPLARSGQPWFARGCHAPSAASRPRSG